MGELLSEWTVDFGDQHEEHLVELPHAWQREAPVDFEGPVWYRREVEVPRSGAWLLFHSVSYSARVVVNGTEIGAHEGMWDAFSVSLDRFKGKTILVEVEVIKTGGTRYPVDQVACGALPYLHQAFGGIWGTVELHEGSLDPLSSLPASGTPRIEVRGRQLYLDGNPFYMRGILNLGWYPEIGHCAPNDWAIRNELETAISLGFNAVKFGHWVPNHRYLEILDVLGLVAWIQLPLYRPSATMDWERVLQEFERIIRQYRRHSCIVAWSLGSEFDEAPVEFRRRLTRLILSLSGAPLVGDGGLCEENPCDFGSFGDYSIPGEVPLYPALSGLSGAGSVRAQATLLGDFAAASAHRDLARLLDDHPFWASALPEYNAPGVRVDNSLPAVLRDSHFAHEPRASGHEELLASSSLMASYVRRRAIEDARSLGGFAGYVLSSWRDTPVSTTGIFNDWNEVRDPKLASVNGHSSLFLLPQPLLDHSGDRVRVKLAGSETVWCGINQWRVGVHSENGMQASGLWRLLRAGSVVAEGSFEPKSVEALNPTEVGIVLADVSMPGEYELRVEFGGVASSWSIYAVDRSPIEPLVPVIVDAPLNCGIPISNSVPETGSFLYFVNQPGWFGDFEAVRKPFWRQAVYQFSPQVNFAEKWGLLSQIQAPLTLDGDSAEVLVKRVDTCTYEESALVVRLKNGAVLTTLWPWDDFSHSPAGHQVLRDLLALVRA